MPPKAAKMGSAKKPLAGAAVDWEAGLIRAQFEEESWQACVCLVAGRNQEDEKLIQALVLAVQQPQRKLFTSVTWDSTLTKIHELGNLKAKKPDGVPMYYEVTEAAKVLLDAGEEIPCDLMAKILKFQLLQIKDNDQQMKREASKANEDNAKAPPPSASKDKGGAKGSDKKPKDSLSPAGSSKKTKLKRRDDVEPPKFIDDEPDDGPQHYILLLGFYQPRLIAALDALGVHVSNVIKLTSEHSKTCKGQQGQQTSEGNKKNQRTSQDVAAEVQGGGELPAQTKKLDLFWSGLRPVLESRTPDSKLHDVAQLSYIVPGLSPPFHTQAVLELGSQIFKGVANLIYDCLDWRRQHQHYRDNIKLIPVPTAVGLEPQPAEVVSTSPPVTKKKSVLEESPPVQDTVQPPHFTDVDMRYYSNLLDLVPPEACSVPLILHCILEQVVVSAEQPVSVPSHVAEESESHNGPCLDHQLVSYMLQSFLPLVHTEDKSHLLNSLLTTVQNDGDRKRLVEKFGAEEMRKKTPEHPLIIRHHDERALRLRDVVAVQGFDPVEVEMSMMKLSAVLELIHSAVQQRNCNSSWMALKQQLQHHCTDDGLPWSEVERLFHQSVFESMPLTKLDQNGILLNAIQPLEALEPAQQTPTINPWDNPLAYAQHQLHKLRTKGPTFFTEDVGNAEQISGRVFVELALSDIQSCRLRSLCDWHYAEHHNPTIFPQVLQLASEEYRCLDTFRGSHDNTLYIFCHTPMSPHRHCKESWHVALHSDVKFRKYLEHVADTISEWTKEEEVKREAMQLRSLSPAECLKDEKATNSVEDEETLEPVIRKDSLKAWKLEQEQLKEEETVKKSKKENTPKGKQQKEESRLTDTKKSHKTPGNSAKTPTASITNTVPPVEENVELHPTEEPFNGFTGYSMDGKLIHVSGHLQYLFPSDGGQITVENVSYVEGSSLMKVTVKKDRHHFYTHINHVVVDAVKTQPQDTINKNDTKDFKAAEPVEVKRVKQGSLSAVLDNGVHLSYSFYGSTGECRGSPHESQTSVQDPATFPPIPFSPSTVRSKATDLDSSPSKRQTPINQIRTSEIQSMVCESQPELLSHPFNSLNLSVPNGLLLQFLREDAQGVSTKEQGMLVRQSFPLHGRGEVGQLQDPSLTKELSRIVTSQGAVIRYMRDGSTEVLFADGSVSFSQDSGPVWVPDSEVEEESTQETEDNKKEKSSEKESAQRGCWLTTIPSGARICTIGTTHKHIPTTSLLAFKATDPITHQVMLTREDLVVSVQNPDGSHCVEHADGTRITRLYQDRPPNTLAHMLLHTGQLPESVTFKSTSECACGYTECACATRCAESINENMHIQDTCDNREEITRDAAGNICDKELSECETSSVYKNGEESAFAKDNVAENGKSSACESAKGSVSTKEQVLLVEKEGYATVVMYPERHTANVILADETVITGNKNGAYQVFPSSLGLLQIQSDGKCVYSSDPLIATSPKSGSPTNQPGTYIMSHTDDVACDIRDPDGNHFQVLADGQISVLNITPAPSTFKHEEEEPEEEEERELAWLHEKRREHCPRLFLVHEDGSGTEFLSSQTVEEQLYQAYSDPSIALLKEPLPDTQDEFGITILKPSHRSVWSRWLLGKQNPDITPPNLKNRSWHDFPRVEKKTSGPPFGTNMGRGLTLRERPGGSVAQRQPVRSCPDVLEMRELYQHRPFTTQRKHTVDTRLKEYIESLMEREHRSEEVKVKDPRTEEESVHASHLLNLVLSFAEEENEGHTFDKRTSVDIASLYSQGVGASAVHSEVSEDMATAASDRLATVKESKWTEKLAQYRHERNEEKACRVALREKSVVPYFNPENIPLYQNLLQHPTPDIKRLSVPLPLIPKEENTEACLKDAPQENRASRPFNPTSSQSASHAGGSNKMPEKRPTDPKPQTADESSPRGSSGKCPAVQLDVTGKPRRTKVRLPSSILGSKPRSIPNQQFLSVEEPVRRKCRTISLTDPHVIMRGFQLLPASVDFGTLREGTASAITVVMKNVGVDTCRFHVKQPPPATGLRVIYNPGPVAAGLQVELQVQLFAICAVRAGEAEPKKYISEDVLINTETEILYLPVTATILPERLYDIWIKDPANTNNKKSTKVLKVSSSLPAGQRPSTLLSDHAANTGDANRTTNF